jgi:hypothetical protein
MPVFPEDRYQGRGVVLCGGGNYYFPCVWVCIRMLRGVGCTLPIELWHRGPREMTDEMKALVEPYDVVCRDAYAVSREFPVRRLDGWELKPYAIVHSRFAEVFYIDADNVAVRDPEYLFDAEQYRITGSLFWPDAVGPASAPQFLLDEAWELLGLPVQQEPEFETGQIVVDKRRCWRPLRLTLHLNEHSDYYYTVFFGDKDTFHLAWRKAGQEYGMVPHPPVVLGEHLVMVQSDPEGNRLFQHRCNAKWTLVQRNERIAGFLFEETCLELLRELAASWPGGSDACPTPVTPVERVAFDEIVRGGGFLCQMSGREQYSCSFLPDRTAILNDESYEWQIEEDKEGEAVLIFALDGRRLCFLRRTPQGSWTGAWLYGERPWVEIRKTDVRC